MNPMVTAFVGLALVATSNALPIGSGFAGISLAPGALNTFYSQEVTLGTFPAKAGFGYEKDGTVSAGISISTKLHGKDLPIAISVSGHPKDLKRTFKFEVGARLLDSLSGVIYGDRSGIKWLTSFWVPVENESGLNALGVSLEGDRTKATAISGGIGINGKVYEGRVAFDENKHPSGVNFFVMSQQNVGLKKH